MLFPHFLECVSLCACMLARARACVFVCMRVCVRVSARVCVIVFVSMCVLISGSWQSLFGMIRTLFVSTKTELMSLFKNFIETSQSKEVHLAQIDFYTLANNAACSSKRKHKPCKYGIKWCRIKYSFRKYMITFHSNLGFKMKSMILSVKFFFDSHGSAGVRQGGLV